MKKYLLFLLALSPLFVMAQKNKFKDVELGIDFLPSEPLQGDFKTYSVVILNDGFDLSTYGTSKGTLAKSIVLDKYDRVDSKGDFEIVITFDNPEISAKLVETKKATEKDGKKTTWTEYSYNVSYRAPVSYTISDGERKVMIREVATDGKYSSKKIGTYRSKSKLNEEYAKRKKGLLEGAFYDSFSIAKNMIISRHDHFYAKRKGGFFTIKKAKKKGLQSFENAYLAAKAMCAMTIKEKQPVEKLKAKMTKAVATWEKALKDFSPTERKQRQVYEAAGYNLAKYYIIIGDYDAAKLAVKKLKKNPKSKSEAAGLEKDITFFTKRIEANKNVPNTFVGTYKAGSVSQAAVDAKGKDFVVMKSGKIIYGKSSFDKKGVVGVITVYADGGKKQLIDSQIEKIHSGGKVWIPAPVRVGSSWMIGMAEVIEVNDHIKCYMQDLGGRLEIVKVYLLKKGKKTPIDLVTLDMISNFNKKLAAKFPECPTVQKNLLSGKYDGGDEFESMGVLARDYHEAMK